MLRYSVLALFAFLAAPRGWALGLEEYYSRALKQSELLQGSSLDIRINRSERESILTTRKARVSLNADGSYHVTKPDREVWGNAPEAGVRTEFRQPLFDGGYTRTAIVSSDARIEASQWDYKTQQQNIFLQVARLFYELLGQRRDLANLEETVKVYRSRIGTLTEREKIGRSRNAEVLAARTQFELLRSSIAETKTNMGAAEEQLAWLTGLAVPLTLHDKLSLADVKLEPPAQEYLMPSVQAAEARIRAATADIELQRTALAPSLDFIASHNWRYLDPSEQGSHDFAIGLGFNWTLYDAGSINAAVTTASLIRNQAEVARQLAHREGGLNLSLARRRLVDSLEQIKTYQSALEVAERTLTVQQQEFDSGLITNLDLLTSLDQKVQIRRNLEQATNRAKLIYIEAQVYSGALANEARPGS